MPAKIDQQTTSNDYSTACTISGVFGSNGGYFNVTGADAFVELGYGKQGQEQWTGETHLGAGSTGAILQGTSGIRFRSYTAGSPATISAAIFYPAEPSLILSSPGTANVTANVGYQHNGAAVASQPNLDFEDVGTVWSVTNDAANSRVRVGWNPPCCRVYNSVSISIPNNSTTKLTFDSERYDTDGIHDVAVNNSRLTAPVAGVYNVFATVAWQANATGIRSLDFIVNNTTLIAADTVPVSVGVSTSDQTLQTQWKFAAGDYVEIEAYQNCGAPLNVNQAASYSLEFGMVLIAAG